MGWKYAYRLIIITIMIHLLTHILKIVYLTKQASILLKYTKPFSVKRLKSILVLQIIFRRYIIYK